MKVMEKHISTKHTDRGEIALKVLITPNDLNHHGTVFGGAILSYFDLAASGYAMEQVGHKVVLVSMKNSAFLAPVFANEYLTFYAKTSKRGNTSLTAELEAWRSNPSSGSRDAERVAIAEITMVAVGDDLRPRQIREGMPDKEVSK